MLAKSSLLALSLWLLGGAAHADIIAKPHTFVAGTPAQASQVNADFDTIYNNYNGNITNANIKANAGIVFSKLNFTGQLGPILRAATNECVGCGTTGDTNSRWSAWTDGSTRWGSGSGAADAQLKRAAANTLQLSNPASTSYGELRLGVMGFYPTTADTQPSIKVIADGSTNGIYFGPGGSSAVDYQLKREASTSGLAIMNAAGSAYKAIDVSALYINGGGPITPASFGGSGSQGVVTQGNQSFTGPTRFDATLFNQTPATTMTVTDGALNINSTGAANITGNIVMACSTTDNGGLGGGTSSTSLRGANGGGAGGGVISQYDGAGGNGGNSFLGAGGAGGHNGTSGQAGTTGQPGGSFYAQTGGGSGGNSIVMTATSNGGTGGSGQHEVVICSISTLQFFSVAALSVNGSSGTAGAVATTSNAAGGGAGGAGGNIILASQTAVSGSAGAVVSATGGAGGAAGRNVSGNAGGGAGGAAGSLIIWAPTYAPNGWTITLTGGAGGAGIGTGASGANGETTTEVTIAGTPNAPLIVHLREHPERYRAVMRAIGQIAQAEGKQGAVQIPHNMMCHIAAEGDFIKYCKLQTERGLTPLAESTCLEISDEVVLKDRS